MILVYKSIYMFMGRSARIRKDYIEKVKAAVQRQGFPRQRELAEELGLSLATVSNFLNGKPVDFLNFTELCERLGFKYKDVIDTVVNVSTEDGTGASSVVLEADNFIYIERPPTEAKCYQTLTEPGALLRIKAPGLMGKTSLMAYLLKNMSKNGYRTALLNFHYAEAADFTNINSFLKWFCVSASLALGVQNKLADYWDEKFSTPKMNCTAYFEEYLLAQAPLERLPLILCLDEVERIFPHDIAADFLGLLRAWHEQAKTRAIWKQLRLVVVHSTEVYIPLRVNESPFNVGVPIELPPFTPEQVQYVAKKYGFAWELMQVKQLMDKVGGHP
jgi:DNA-binding Xre family transcriptional regulator